MDTVIQRDRSQNCGAYSYGYTRGESMYFQTHTNQKQPQRILQILATGLGEWSHIKSTYYYLKYDEMFDENKRCKCP